MSAKPAIIDAINNGELTEDEALSVFYRMSVHYGWAGTVFTRGDAESDWQNQQYDFETGETPDTPLPDSVWNRILTSWEWRKGIAEILTERGWDLVSQAVEEAMQADDRAAQRAADANYTVMPAADVIPHTCLTHPDFEGVLMDECDGCDQAAKHPCRWCGYGGAFTTHAPEAHAENGDPNVTDVDAFGDDWCDAPHIYNDPEAGA